MILACVRMLRRRGYQRAVPFCGTWSPRIARWCLMPGIQVSLHLSVPEHVTTFTPRSRGNMQCCQDACML
jgi:hypothetical protein